MQEFPQRGACAPAGDLRSIRFGCLMETANQRGQHMAIVRVIVVARPIEVGGHQADRIKGMLLA